MNNYTRRKVRKRKQRIERRLGKRNWTGQGKPMLTGRNIDYEMGDRMRGLSVGGIGTMHLLARRTGLIEAIDKGVHVLKRHLPYHESDHVLNIAYNGLSGGTCLAPTTRDVFRRSGRGGGRDAGGDDWRMQTRDGRGIRRDGGVSPVVDFPREHRRAVISGDPERQPAVA